MFVPPLAVAGLLAITAKQATARRKRFMRASLGRGQTGFVEQGLWSVAFDPDFKKNGYFYVHYSSLPFNGAGIVLRVTVDPFQLLLAELQVL